LEGYDEPEILPSSTPPICLRSADPGQLTFQMAEVAVSRQMFQEILSLIARMRAPPAPA